MDAEGFNRLTKEGTRQGKSKETCIDNIFVNHWHRDFKVKRLMNVYLIIKCKLKK